MREKIVTTINKLEDQALLLGDFISAIRYNWLRKAILEGMDTDEAIYRYLRLGIVGNY